MTKLPWQLQDIFEYAWLALVDGVSPEVTREDVAQRIIVAHGAGLSPEAIKNKVLLELRAANSAPNLNQVPQKARPRESC